MNSINLSGQIEQTILLEENVSVQVNNMLISILKRMHQFFKSENLRYFAFDLLLQEAVFCHRFFADGKVKSYKIGMLRDEYEKAKKLISKETFENHYEVYKDIFACDNLFHDGNTIKVGSMQTFCINAGLKTEPITRFVCIEIFPFDHVPDDPRKAEDFVVKLRELNDIYIKKINSNFTSNKKRTSWRTKIYDFVSAKCVNQALVKEIEKFKNCTNTVACIVSDDAIKRVNLEQIFPVQECKFHDFLICIPLDSSVWCGELEDKFKVTSEETAIAVATENLCDILRNLDIIFRENGFEYFAFEKLLMHGEYCHDILKDGKLSFFKIGMLRRDFNRAREFLAEYNFPGQDYVRTDELPTTKLLRRTIQIGRRYYYYTLNNKNGNVLFKNQFMGVEICAFDNIPDKYQKAQLFYDEMQKRNIQYTSHIAFYPDDISATEQIESAAEKYLNQTNILACVTPFRSREITLEQLFPLKRCKIRDFEISVPNDSSVWCGELNPNTILLSEEEAVKKSNYDKGEILKVLDKVFTEKGLQYFAYASLLIHTEYYHDFFNSGKVENAKIGMLRDDFEKARVLVEEKLSEFQVRTVIEEISLPRRTIQIGRRIHYYIFDDNNNIKFQNKFVGIEINAFDYVPDEYEQARFHFWQMRKRNTIYSRASVYRMNRAQRKRNTLSNLYGKLSDEFLIKIINNGAKKFNNRTNTVACVTPKKSNIITLEQLFPLKRCKFRNFEISVPNDISVWCHLFTPEVEEQTKSIQKVSLEILKKIDKACQELGIGYFICGGSMLGAVRHGGFIPWDDDIDIGMLRKDYEVFLENGQKLLGDSVFLQTRETDPEIPYLFSKVRANNTLYVTNYNEFRNFHKGICVDIFPFDNIPDNMEEQQKFRKEVRFWEKIHNRVVNKQKPEQYFVSDKKRTLAEKLIHLLNEGHRHFYCLIPLWFTQKLYLRKAEKYNSNTKLEYVASFVPSYTFIKREDLLPYKRMNFSGFQALVPKRPEVFLEMQYGDFMAMPPEHKRMGHDLIKWSADTTKEIGVDNL